MSGLDLDRVLTGGCFCGAIRYEVTGAVFQETLCHCSTCRRTTGAPLVAWFTALRADFRFVAGSPSRFRSSQDGVRTFCSSCGTQLTLQIGQGAEHIDVTTCSLDRPEDVPPRDHTYRNSGPGWIRFDDGLPAYPRARDQADAIPPGRESVR